MNFDEAINYMLAANKSHNKIVFNIELAHANILLKNFLSNWFTDLANLLSIKPNELKFVIEYFDEDNYDAEEDSANSFDVTIKTSNNDILFYMNKNWDIKIHIDEFIPETILFSQVFGSIIINYDKENYYKNIMDKTFNENMDDAYTILSELFSIILNNIKFDMIVLEKIFEFSLS